MLRTGDGRLRGPASYFARHFYSLENASYRLLWAGTGFAFFGMQMQIVARGWLAYDLTGQNTALGAMMLAFGAPSLVFTLWGGVLADRLPRRRTLLISQGILCLNSAWVALMVSIGLIEFWMLLAASFTQGVGFAFMGPARQAFIGSLVGREAVGNAIVLQQLSMNGTRVVGPALAGVFISLWFIGVAGVYFMTAAGFLISILTVLRLPPGEPEKRTETTSPLGDLVDGLRYVKSRPSVAILILTSFALTALAFPFQSFLPSLAEDIYQAGSQGLGILSAVQAVGAVFAVVLVASMADQASAWQRQLFLAIAFGGSVTLLGFASNFAAGLGAILLVGACSAGFQSLNNALSVSYSASRYHGRVQSLTMLSWSLFGIASMPIGVVADIIGIRETLMITGTIGVAAVLALHVIGKILGAEEDRHQIPKASPEEQLRRGQKGHS